MEKKHPRVGLAVFLYNPQGQILLGQRLNVHGAYTWACPGGHVEFGETFEECAQRELLEETGVLVDLSAIHFYTASSDIFLEEDRHYVTLFMWANLPEGALVRNCEPHKNKEWVWYYPEDIPSPLFLSLQNLIRMKGSLFGAIENGNHYP